MFFRETLLLLIHTYWKIFKPKTYGVKVLIFNPENNDEILIVRHSYGNKSLWNLPGGGYNPKKESAKQAAIREVREELDILITELHDLATYYTDTEGKRDTVIIFTGQIPNKNPSLNKELLEYAWRNKNDIIDNTEVARIARYAVRQIK